MIVSVRRFQGWGRGGQSQHCCLKIPDRHLAARTRHELSKNQEASARAQLITIKGRKSSSLGDPPSGDGPKERIARSGDRQQLRRQPQRQAKFAGEEEHPYLSKGRYHRKGSTKEQLVSLTWIVNKDLHELHMTWCGTAAIFFKVYFNPLTSFHIDILLCSHRTIPYYSMLF